jgi:hypothetical protein
LFADGMNAPLRYPAFLNIIDTGTGTRTMRLVSESRTLCNSMLN